MESAQADEHGTRALPWSVERRVPYRLGASSANVSGMHLETIRNAHGEELHIGGSTGGRTRIVMGTCSEPDLLAFYDYHLALESLD